MRIQMRMQARMQMRMQVRTQTRVYMQTRMQIHMQMRVQVRMQMEVRMKVQVQVRGSRMHVRNNSAPSYMHVHVCFLCVCIFATAPFPRGSTTA